MSVNFSTFSNNNNVVSEKIDQTTSSIDLIRDQVLESIRTYFPIQTLFKPKLNMNLGLFIKDQHFFRRLAEFLNTLPKPYNGSIDDIAKELENSSIMVEIKSLLNEKFSTFSFLIYEACRHVLHDESSPNTLDDALNGRIFTFKNALIAQENPLAIQNSQKKNNIHPQSIDKIKEEGAAFIRDCLHFHLKAIRGGEKVPFKQLLTATAEKLIPFVTEITRLHMIENDRTYPQDILRGVDPSGHYPPALIAATIMEACLKVLGYQSCLLFREDLDPKVTLSMKHHIVVVKDSHQQYIVDPTYVQFHKDICRDESSLPSEPVLVLKEDEVDGYIEQNLMTKWRAIDKRIKNKSISKIEEFKLISTSNVTYNIQQLSSYTDLIPKNPELWVRNSFKRVWDIRTYHQVFHDLTYHRIFLGREGTTYKCHALVKEMQLSSLIPYLSREEIENKLKNLLTKAHLKEKNSPEVLTLFAQLPESRMDDRAYLEKGFISFFNMNKTIDTISIATNSYLKCLKQTVNPKGKDLSVIYACSGADCMSAMLATDATDFLFVDLTPLDFTSFEKNLNDFKSTRGSVFDKLFAQMNEKCGYYNHYYNYVGDSSLFGINNGMENISLKVFFNLHFSKVNLYQIALKRIEGGIEMEFPWKCDEASPIKKRKITFLAADITKPNDYPSLLKNKLQEGFDIFYMKAPFFVPRYYPNFLPFIAKSINKNGWLMTVDKMVTMDEVSPDECLLQNDLKFKLIQKTEQIQALEKCLMRPSDPFGIKAQKYDFQTTRINRLPGVDHTYWLFINLRQKK